MDGVSEVDLEREGGARSHLRTAAGEAATLQRLLYKNASQHRRRAHLTRLRAALRAFENASQHRPRLRDALFF